MLVIDHNSTPIGTLNVKPMGPRIEFYEEPEIEICTSPSLFSHSQPRKRSFRVDEVTRSVRIDEDMLGFHGIDIYDMLNGDKQFGMIANLPGAIVRQFRDQQSMSIIYKAQIPAIRVDLEEAEWLFDRDEFTPL